MWRTVDPIPQERVTLEHRLIRALDLGPAAIAETLHSFHWPDHRELACLGLAEIARREGSPERAAALAVTVGPHCDRARGPWCDRCPIQAARAA